MSSPVEICNMGLGRIGEDTILSFDDDNKTSDFCRDNWESIRDSVLRDFAPPCAVKRLKLVRSVDAPSWGYDYQYVLPSDYLRLLEPSEEDGTVKFEIEGGRLLCDLAGPLGIKYVFRQINTGAYDASLVEALVIRVSAEAAWGLKNLKSLAESMWALYREKSQEAKSKQSQERSDTKSNEDEDYDWIMARL